MSNTLNVSADDTVDLLEMMFNILVKLFPNKPALSGFNKKIKYNAFVSWLRAVESTSDKMLGDTNDGLTGLIEQYESRESKTNDEIHQIQYKLKMLQSTNQNLQTEYYKLESKCNLQETEIQKCENALEKLNAKNKQYQAEYENTNKQLEEKDAIISQMQEALHQRRQTKTTSEVPSLSRDFWNMSQQITNVLNETKTRFTN